MSYALGGWVDVEIGSALLNKNCSVNETDDEGRTALHYCALSNNALLAQMLMDKGANKDAQDERVSIYRFDYLNYEIG